MPVLLAAFLLGFVAGLRAFTAPAVLWLMRYRAPIAYVLGVLALVEYAGDLSPKAPPRTQALGLIARVLSGAVCGWWLSLSAGATPAIGAIVGAVGAIVGAYAGLATRMRAIRVIGGVPAALLEDLLAVVGAVLIVAYS